MQPVDSAALAELRNRLPIAKGLLCAGSIVTLEWTATSFSLPITVCTQPDSDSVGNATLY